MFYGDIESEPPNIRMLFHDYTLSQLAYLRGALDHNDPRDRFLLASLTGLLHGATAKDGASSHFLSISMPNTFSMSPNYIRGYVETHGLKKVKTDVFDTLRWKIERLYRHGRPELRGYAHQAGAQRLVDIPNPHLKRKEVQLVISLAAVFESGALRPVQLDSPVAAGRRPRGAGPDARSASQTRRLPGVHAPRFPAALPGDAAGRGVRPGHRRT